MKSPNETFAVLAPNLVVSGNLVSEGNIHVDGTVEGDVQTVHLTIGASGVVKGRVFGREVKISGRVIGSITACELVLEESAIIEGDIHYQSLSVARGARVNGNCQFSEAELDITVLSGKKSLPKSEGALAFGDAAMEATASQKSAVSRAKASSSAQ
jgi:cytoskeletal protein CcmA (bactofilin family)